jgi:hypothetical protein
MSFTSGKCRIILTAKCTKKYNAKGPENRAKMIFNVPAKKIPNVWDASSNPDFVDIGDGKQKPRMHE